MTPIDQFLLFVALPVVVLCALAEGVWLARRGSYDWRAAGVSYLDLALRIGLQITLRFSLAAPLIALAYTHRIQTLEIDTAAALAALFIGQEFCYYGFHRASHRMRWFWANHAVHHSPNELNLSAALRIGALSRLSGTGVFYVPLVWLGFPPRVVFAMLSLNLLYQFWIHATWIPKLGFLEGWINTPSAHRVHHATNLEYLDANYGGVLLVFDRLFGTYRAEREDLAPRYGLLDPMTSHNPLKVELREWSRLVRDVVRAPSVWVGLQTLVRPPGWKPGVGMGHTTEELRARAAAAAAAAPTETPRSTGLLTTGR